MGAWKTIKGYLDLCRISNLPSVWTNVLCATILSTGQFSWQLYLPPALSLSCLYLAGMCLNDLCDASLDRIQRPSRPIPSGRVSRQGAMLLTLSLFVAGFAFLLRPPHQEALFAAALLVAMIVWYDFHHKQNPASVLLMAACRLMVFVVTALAVTGDIRVSVWIAGIAQYFYVLCISVVARFEYRRAKPFKIPVIPLMLAGIALMDGILLAIFAEPVWLVAGIAGAALLLSGQWLVRGD